MGIHVIAVLLFMLAAGSAWAECRGDIPGRMTDRYLTDTNGTVIDRYTGLMWTRCDMGRRWDPLSQQCDPTSVATSMNWEDTLRNAGSTFYAGYDDWRLPNVKELASLIERHCSPQINSSVFLDSKSFYWSSTPLPYLMINDDTQQFETAAWQVPYIAGTDIQARLTSSIAFARLVRTP